MPGEKTALEMANLERPLELEDDGEQIDMLASLGLPINENVIALREARTGKPGRPPNSRNKRTVEMANYLLSRYKSPLEVLAQIAATPIAELAASLKCTNLEAMQEIRLAAIALKDHLHSKMPVAVDVTNRKVIHLTIHEDGVPTSGTDGAGLVGEIIDLSAHDVTPPERPDEC
jgi:hypothetical protein